jgi:hypothetical protein
VSSQHKPSSSPQLARYKDVSGAHDNKQIKLKQTQKIKHLKFSLNFVLPNPSSSEKNSFLFGLL